MNSVGKPWYFFFGELLETAPFLVGVTWFYGLSWIALPISIDMLQKLDQMIGLVLLETGEGVAPSDSAYILCLMRLLMA